MLRGQIVLRHLPSFFSFSVVQHAPSPFICCMGVLSKIELALSARIEASFAKGIDTCRKHLCMQLKIWPVRVAVFREKLLRFYDACPSCASVSTKVKTGTVVSAYSRLFIALKCKYRDRLLSISRSGVH